MPSTDTQVQQLVINVGTTAQIEAAIAGGQITEDMLSITTDGGDAVTDVEVNGTSVVTDGVANIDLTGYESKATITALSATDSITLTDNTIYNGGNQTALTIALPSTDSVGFLCEVVFTSAGTATTMSYPNTIKWIGDEVSSNVFTPTTNKRYTIMIYYDGSEYVAIVKGVA